jgi:hypothetical protein
VHDLRSQGEFRHPGHIKSRRAVKDNLPEGRRSGLVANVENEVRRADHPIDDIRDNSAAVRHRGTSGRRPIRLLPSTAAGCRTPAVQAARAGP